MKRYEAFSNLALLSFLPQAIAWGSLGHQTVAYIASNFVESETRDLFQSILHNTSDAYLANVATWADSFRYTAAGRFTAPFHFIDAEDDPPASCSVKYTRDCGNNGCVVTAIQNYTNQVLDLDLSAGQINMAAKFVIHFVGDIHQPLHDESVDRGGNSINCTFDGKATNLHRVWDSNIPEKLIGGYALAFAQKWSATLTDSIKNGAYSYIAESWLNGVDLSDPITTALSWAEESNRLVCTTVLPIGVAGVENQELSGDYYETAIPVVQLQIAKAGYRLARWLDLIAARLNAKGEL